MEKLWEKLKKKQKLIARLITFLSLARTERFTTAAQRDDFDSIRIFIPQSNGLGNFIF